MPGVLLVHQAGGPPAGDIIPKVAAIADTHLLMLGKLIPSTRALAEMLCSSVIDRTERRHPTAELVDLIERTARDVRADAIVTFDEFSLLYVAEANRRLGLRGPGHNTILSRDKVVMRQTWEAAGVPVPPFRPVDSLADLERAWRELRPPILLKAALSAGGIGQLVIRRRDELEPALRRSHAALDYAVSIGKADFATDRERRPLIAEEVIRATTEGWYDQPGYGDYISVEGLVVDGEYHPICVTSRLPTIEPFSEIANLVPCAIPEPLQRRIEQTARDAVNCFGLETCGTHTEIKLMAGGRLCLVESAARLAGWTVTREVETAFRVDMISELVRALLGDRPALPDRMLTEAHRCVAGVALIATDAAGRPWSSLPVYDPARIDWSAMLSPGSTVEPVTEMTIPPGTQMARYDPDAGILGASGALLLEATDPQTLLRDAYAIVNGMEGAIAGRPPVGAHRS